METAWHGKDMARTGSSPALRLGQENGMARQASTLSPPSVEQSKSRGGAQTEGPPFFLAEPTAVSLAVDRARKKWPRTVRAERANKLPLTRLTQSTPSLQQTDGSRPTLRMGVNQTVISLAHGKGVLHPARVGCPSLR